MRSAEQDQIQPRHSQSSTRNSPGKSSPSRTKQPSPPIRRSLSSDPYHNNGQNGSGRYLGHQLPPIPGSPYITDASAPPSPISRKSTSTPVNGKSNGKPKDNPAGKTSPNGNTAAESLSRARSKSSSYISHRSPPPQSLNAAVEMLTASHSDSGHSPHADPVERQRTNGTDSAHNASHANENRSNKPEVPPLPRRPIPAIPGGGFWRSASVPALAGKAISGPVLNHGNVFILTS